MMLNLCKDSRKNPFYLMKTLNGNEVGEKMMKFSPDLICMLNRNGYFVFVSEASKRIIGYESKELVNCRFVDVIHPEDCDKVVEAVRDVIEENKATYFENKCIHKSGKEVSVEWSVAWSEEDEAFFCTGRNAAGQKPAKQWLREKDKMYQSLIEHGSDILTLFDEELNYVYCGGSILRELGYEPAQLIGANALNFIHPEDIPLIRESLAKALTSEEQVNIPEYRFKDAKGDWRWLESRGRSQLQNPLVKAVVASSRDVTERVNNRLKLQESEQRFQSLFDHHLDMALLQNKEGVIIDVNAATLSFFGIQKEDLVNQPLSEFLSAEVIPDFEQGLQDALHGKPVQFVSTAPFEEEGQEIFDIVKIPVIVDEEVVGIYCIFRDITELIRSGKTIKKQAEKLDIILESITDAFFALNRNWNFTYYNSEFEKIFGTDKEELLGKNIWQLSSPVIKRKFYRQFQGAVETKKAARFKIYYDRFDRWLQIKAYPSEEGLSVFIYDITEKLKSRQELEKLSLVASKTTNGVIICDGQGKTEWVNEGFTELTGFSLAEISGKRPDKVLLTVETHGSTVEKISEKLEQKESYSEEMLVYKKSGEKVWLSVSITPILNEAGEVTRIITLQTDITDRKEAEKSQLQMTKDLFRQNRDLQQFTYVVSHNLRAPVANLVGLAGLLNTVDKGSDTFDASLQYLKKGANQLDTVLKDLNMILSVRDKKDTPGREKVALAPVCQEVITSLEDTLKSCGGKVLINMEEDVSVNGNRAYLYSIFYNLLSNSIKYRSPNQALEVTINCDKDMIVSFSDNGLGFDVEKAGDNLFRLYKRFHNNFEGRGIGLFLVKTHVEAMDGHIEVRSQVNEGTTFLLCLNRTL